MTAATNVGAIWRPTGQGGREWDRDRTRRGYHMTPTASPTWAPHPPVPTGYWLADEYRKRRALPPSPAAAAIYGIRGVGRGVMRGIGRGI